MAKTPAQATKTTKKPVVPRAPKRSKSTAPSGFADEVTDAGLSATKPKGVKAKKPEAKTARSVIAQLAADIVEDRILPTIDQIKSIATSVLGQDQPKGKKTKGKKKK